MVLRSTMHRRPRRKRKSGSLVAEVMKSDLELHDDIAEGFERWRETFRPRRRRAA